MYLYIQLYNRIWIREKLSGWIRIRNPAVNDKKKKLFSLPQDAVLFYRMHWEPDSALLGHTQEGIAEIFKICNAS